MNVLLTPQNHSEISSDYHGFHDAEIRAITIRPLPDRLGILEVEVELRARNHRTGTIEEIRLFFGRVVEVNFSYDAQFDYPNIRDDMVFGFFENLVYVDFWSGSEPRTSPEQFREAESYLVCESVRVEALSIRIDTHAAQ